MAAGVPPIRPSHVRVSTLIAALSVVLVPPGRTLGVALLSPGATVSAQDRATLPPFTGEVLGRPDAPITIVEFTDLQCPSCSRFTAQTFDQLRRTYIDTGTVRFISRDLPLAFHGQAMRAARAARCAGEQGQFWELRKALVLNASRLSARFIQRTAAALGLDMPQFSNCAASDRHDVAIRRDAADAVLAGITNTPSFVIGRTEAKGLDGVVVVGAQPLAVFDATIRELLKN